jgi:hypothetical protein
LPALGDNRSNDVLPPFFRIALCSGLLSAIGPFAIDMYLPALPAIGQRCTPTSARCS